MVFRGPRQTRPKANLVTEVCNRGRATGKTCLTSVSVADRSSRTAVRKAHPPQLQLEMCNCSTTAKRHKSGSLSSGPSLLSVPTFPLNGKGL